LEAAVGLGNLEVYDKILNKRHNNLSYLIKHFSKFAPVLETIREEDYEQIGPHAFPVVVGKEANFSRDELVDYLRNYGIDSRSLFLSMPTQCPGFNFLGYQLGQFPQAEYMGNNGLHIGVHQDLDKRHLDHFLETTEKFLSQKIN